jgi:hypothetical protein
MKTRNFICLQRADLAITDLTITFDRESAVDFTMPFMNLGRNFLFFCPNEIFFDSFFKKLFE